jgi:hypothetical protein
MGNQQTVLTKRSIDTSSGRISYTEAGSGPVALFLAPYSLDRCLIRRAAAAQDCERSYQRVSGDDRRFRQSLLRTIGVGNLASWIARQAVTSGVWK